MAKAEVVTLVKGVRLDLTTEEAAVLNRLLFSHIGGVGAERAALDEISMALTAVEAPMTEYLEARAISRGSMLRDYLEITGVQE